MRFKDFISKNELPKELLELLKNKRIIAINLNHVSGDLVYDIENEYILKISNNMKSLRKEMLICNSLDGILNTPKLVYYGENEEYAYFLKTKLHGKSLVSKTFLNRPKLLAFKIKEALKLFHSVMPQAIYNEYNNGAVFIHGDFCLPNILALDNGEIGFIDLSDAGIGDPYIDYYWAIWSLEYNLGTSEYTSYLLDLLAIQIDDFKFFKYVGVEYGK